MRGISEQAAGRTFKELFDLIPIIKLFAEISARAIKLESEILPLMPTKISLTSIYKETIYAYKEKYTRKRQHRRVQTI